MSPLGEALIPTGDFELISFYYKISEQIGAVGACSVERVSPILLAIMFECADIIISNWEQLYPGFK